RQIGSASHPEPRTRRVAWDPPYGGERSDSGLILVRAAGGALLWWSWLEPTTSAHRRVWGAPACSRRVPPWRLRGLPGNGLGGGRRRAAGGRWRSGGRHGVGVGRHRGARRGGGGR